MPIFEYDCQDCGTFAELLIRTSESPTCPQCGGEKLDKRFSVPAAPSTGSTSAPAMNGGCGVGPPCGAPMCGRLRRS